MYIKTLDTLEHKNKNCSLHLINIFEYLQKLEKKCFKDIKVKYSKLN